MRPLLIDDVRITALEGNNTINSAVGENVSIITGAGKDSIVNAMGLNINIYAGDGDNIVENYVGENVIIGTGKDNDVIVNYGDKVSINAGEGNNLIYSDGDSNTILSGTGDDIIVLEETSPNSFVRYIAGNKYIYGFNENSTLSIADDATYSSVKNGNDLIFTIGENKITLEGVANLKTVNIAGKWTYSSKKALYKVGGKTLITVSGVKSVDGISLSGTTVTLKASNLNKKTVTISKGYTLELADDVEVPVKTEASWSKVASGKATYNYESTTAGYTLANNKISYTKAVAPKSFTLSGIKSTSGIKVDGTTVTL